MWLTVYTAVRSICLFPWFSYPHFGDVCPAPKLYFLDSGLLCYLLRIRSPDELRSHASRGAIFETYVLSEFYKNFVHHGTEPDLFFWRDSTGHEIDLLLEMGPDLIPIEIKSGQTVASDFFSDINYWRALAGHPDGDAGLVYGGNSSYKRQGVSVVSWSAWG